MQQDFSIFFSSSNPVDGYNALLQNMKFGMMATKELLEFLRESARVQEECVRSHSKLEKMLGSHTSLGTLTPVVKICQNFNERFGALHKACHAKLAELVKGMAKYVESQLKMHKRVQREEDGDTLDVIKNVHDLRQQLAKSRRHKMSSSSQKSSASIQDASNSVIVGDLLGQFSADTSSPKQSSKSDDETIAIQAKLDAVLPNYTACIQATSAKFRDIELFHVTHVRQFLESYSLIVDECLNESSKIHTEFQIDIADWNVDNLMDRFVQVKCCELGIDLSYLDQLNSAKKSMLSHSVSNINQTVVDNNICPVASFSVGNQDDEEFQPRVVPPAAKKSHPAKSKRHYSSSISNLMFVGLGRSSLTSASTATAPPPAAAANENQIESAIMSEPQERSLASSHSSSCNDAPTRGRTDLACLDDLYNRYDSDSQSESDDEWNDNLQLKLNVRINPLRDTPDSNSLQPPGTDGEGLSLQGSVSSDLSHTASATADELQQAVKGLSLYLPATQTRPNSTRIRSATSNPNSQENNSTAIARPKSRAFMPFHQTVSLFESVDNDPWQSRLESKGETQQQSVLENHKAGDLFGGNGDDKSQVVAFSDDEDNSSGEFLPPTSDTQPECEKFFDCQDEDRDDLAEKSEDGSIQAGIQRPRPIQQSVPVAIAVQEVCHAIIGPRQPQIRLIGDIMISVPASALSLIQQSLRQTNRDIGNSRASKSNLVLALSGTNQLESVVENKRLVVRSSYSNDCDHLTFDMDALLTVLKDQYALYPEAAYINVDLVKYQLKRSENKYSELDDGERLHQGCCPIQMTAYWRTTPEHTDVRIDYSVSSDCIGCITDQKCSVVLEDVTFASPIDGQVVQMQSQPTGQWQQDVSRAVWPLDSLPIDKSGTIRSRFKMSAPRDGTQSSTESPRRLGPVAVQFRCEGATLSNIDISVELPDIDDCDLSDRDSDYVEYTLNFVKRRFISGKYLCQPTVP